MVHEPQAEDTHQGEERAQQGPADPQSSPERQDLGLQVGHVPVEHIQGHDNAAELAVSPVAASRPRDAADMGDGDITVWRTRSRSRGS